MSTYSISVEGLTKRYRDVTAVDDLWFTVRPGAVTGFLGPNGAGKTTSLAAIVGLIRPTVGRVLIDGTPIGSTAPDARRLGVHIESSGAHPGRSARDHLRSLAALAGLPRRRVEEVLEIVRERAAGGGTVLLSSHVLTEAAQTVDDVVVIHRGRLVRQGSIQELERLGASGVFVSSPTRERLAMAVQRAGGMFELQHGDGLVVHGMSAVAGAAIAALTLVVTLTVGLPLLEGEPGPSLDGRDLTLVAGGSVLAAAVSTIMGVALGALVRNQVAAVIGAVLLIFVVMPLLAAVSQPVFESTPFMAAVVVAGDPSAETLSWGGGALVLAGWTLPLLAAAIVLERRRDVG